MSSGKVKVAEGSTRLCCPALPKAVREIAAKAQAANGLRCKQVKEGPAEGTANG